MIIRLRKLLFLSSRCLFRGSPFLFWFFTFLFLSQSQLYCLFKAGSACTCKWPLCPNKTVFSCFSCLETVLLFILDVFSHSKARLFPRVSARYPHLVCSGGLVSSWPPTPASSPQWRHHGWKMRKQKRGKGGVKSTGSWRLRTLPSEPGTRWA